MNKIEWILCPICKNKTRTKIRPDTILENFPLFCPKCKQETLVNTLKGIGMSLGISTNLEAVTAQYVDVRLERKKTVLETYHKTLHPQKNTTEKGAEQKDTPKKSKKKSSEMEL